MYKKVSAYFFLVSIAFLLTGCFDITEEVTVNRDGSGNAKLIIDFGSLSTLMNSAGTSNADSLFRFNNKNDSSLTEIKNNLNKVIGVSNIYAGTGKDNFNFVISFDFANELALNTGLSKIIENNMPVTSYYEISKGKIKRNAATYLNNGNNNSNFSGSTQEAAMVAILASAHYKVKIHLPDNAKKIKIENTNALRTGDEKTVMLEQSLADILQKKSSLEMTIKYK